MAQGSSNFFRDSFIHQATHCNYLFQMGCSGSVHAPTNKAAMINSSLRATRASAFSDDCSTLSDGTSILSNVSYFSVGERRGAIRRPAPQELSLGSGHSTA